MGVLTPISIGNLGEQVLTIPRGCQKDLGNPGKFLADDINVIFNGCPEPVRIDLLIKIDILGVALA